METLSAAGVEVVAATDSRQVTLRHEGTQRSFALRHHARTPRAGELAAAPSPETLLIAPRLSASLQSRLLELGWSWVTDAGQLHLRFPDHTVGGLAARTNGPAAHPPEELALPGRGRGTFAVLRRLLLGRAPLRQADLASTAWVTQPRVSQILATLADNGLVKRDQHGWRVADWDHAVRLWLARYPGPGGVITYWTGLDDAWSQTLTALAKLPTGGAVSGDVGADLLVPWRQPQRATIYAPALSDLSATGSIQVGSSAEATLIVCVPADPSVWPTQPLTGTFRDHSVNVADPLQVLWDVQSTGDEDSRQAAEHLETWLRHRFGRARDD